VRVGRINQAEITRLASSPAMDRHLRTVAQQIADEAARHAPFRTGRLRASITVERVGSPPHREWRVGWAADTAPYGGLVELGTMHYPARPHLRPAARKVQGR
jgi:HK97 gp10 family phage protein